MQLTKGQIEALLPIDKNRLDDALEVQAQMTYEITAEIIAASTRMVWCKEDLDKIDAEIYVSLRDGSKTTEGEIKANQLLDNRNKGAFASYQDAKRDHERWVSLLDAWRARGFSLTTLANLHSANYFAVNSAGKERDYSANRQALARARTEPAVTPRRRVLAD